MNCKKCGKEIDTKNKFCQYCGAEIVKEEKVEKVNVEKVTTKNVETTKSSGNGLAIAGMIIGIVAIILSIFLNIFVLIIPLVGLIISFCAKKSGYKTAGIVTNIIAVVIEIVLFIIGLIFASSFISTLFSDITNNNYKNDIYGAWQCISTDPANKEITVIKFKKDGTYIYGPSEDLSNNHYSGTYTATEETIKNEGYDNVKFYNIDGEVTEFIVEGYKKSTIGKKLDMEFSIGKHYDNKDEAYILFYSTNNTYYCERTYSY